MFALGITAARPNTGAVVAKSVIKSTYGGDVTHTLNKLLSNSFRRVAASPTKINVSGK